MLLIWNIPYLEETLPNGKQDTQETFHTSFFAINVKGKHDFPLLP